MKRLIATFKLWRYIYKNVELLKVIEQLGKFLNGTHEKQQPMVTRIALINMGDGNRIGDFISLWAGIGEISPIERIRHLKAQNEELLKLLKIAKEGNLSKEQKELIEMTINVFEM